MSVHWILSSRLFESFCQKQSMKRGDRELAEGLKAAGFTKPRLEVSQAAQSSATFCI